MLLQPIVVDAAEEPKVTVASFREALLKLPAPSAADSYRGQVIEVPGIQEERQRRFLLARSIYVHQALYTHIDEGRDQSVMPAHSTIVDVVHGCGRVAFRWLIARENRPFRRVLPDFPEAGHKGIKFNVFTTGPNLSEAERLDIFEEGNRAENSQRIEGSGHGLNFIRRVIEVHGGRVGCEATDEGNNFYFILPVSFAGSGEMTIQENRNEA